MRVPTSVEETAKRMAALVYVFEASIITFIVLMTAKVQRIFETTKYFRDFFVL